MSTPKLISSTALAERLGLGNETTVRKWRLKGYGPTYLKVGRRVFYSEDAVSAWLASIARTSTSQMAA